MVDEIVFDSDRMLDSPGALQKTNMGSNASATNAFKQFSKGNTDLSDGSPNRKHILNKKFDSKSGGKSAAASSGNGSKGGTGANAINELSPQALQTKNQDLQTVGAAGQRSQPGGASAMDVKDLGVVGGKKRVDQNDSQGAINLNSQKEDSFQKLYSKELDLDEDEVPIILHELNDSAIHFISHEQYERSLSLLQKAQTLLDRLKFQKNPKDRFLIQVTMHNMALCFQKMGALEECALCLDACLHQINSQYLAPIFSKKPTKKLKKLKYECKIHMQVCALLSQLHRHEEALLHAKQAVQISQYLVNDLVSLCELNVEKTIVAKKKEQEVHEEQERQKLENGGMSMSQTSSQADLIYYDHSISMLERTALRVFPIIKEIQNRMVKHKDVNGQGGVEAPPKSNKNLDSYLADNQPLNMKVLLGYLNQSEWLYLLNIGNIMQITPLTIHDLYSNQKIDVELSRDSILEKVTFLAISYFCVSTELRFLVSSKEKLSFDPVYVKAESEFWHGKALEISCGFLPSESPLVTHILSSYQKHHAPVQQAIPENEEEDQGLRVIRPEKGIDKSQFQPIIRLNKHLNIALSPLRLSPNNHRLQPKKKVDMKEVSVSANLIVQQPPQQQQLQQQQQQLAPPATINLSDQKQSQQQSTTSYNNDVEQSAILLQAAGMNNPSKRSIEFERNQSQVEIQSQSQLEQQKSQQQIPGSDQVEFELQSFDQNDIKQERPQAKQSSRVGQNSQQQQQQQRQNQQQQQQQRPQQEQQQASTTTPSRQTDQQLNNKIQMAVPSPNALASAMQREQLESLQQFQSVQHQQQERVVSGYPQDQLHQQQTLKQQETKTTKNALQSQRQVKNNNLDQLQQQDNGSSTKQGSQSYHALPKGTESNNNNNVGSQQIQQDQQYHKQQNDPHLFREKDVRSIDEEALIQMATEGGNQYTNGVKQRNQQQQITPPQSEPSKLIVQHQQQTKQLTRENINGSQNSIRNTVSQKQLSSNNRGQTNQISSKQLKTSANSAAGELIQSDHQDERTTTPGISSTQQSARFSQQNLLPSQRSRSKGKLSKKKGAMTQPQTHQNSANTTAYEPLRQALQNKEISHFNVERKRGDVTRGAHSLDPDEPPTATHHAKVRPTHAKPSFKGGPSGHTQSKVGAGRIATSSLENREHNNVVRPPSNNNQINSKTQANGDGAVQRPDSRRLIGGKRRYVKDNSQKQESSVVRSNSAGRQNQNQTLQMNYKTNDQSMTSANSQVQFNMNGQQISNGNQNNVSANNFKTFQSTRKAVTANSTQASNSPRKALPSQKMSESNHTTNVAARLNKKAQGANVQDPVFMNTNQLNQSRSTIENNNSLLIDRSMNDQLMLNNSSFEVGNQSRSRSFAKTGGLSQQNSRDVIVGSKKKTIGQHNGQQQIIPSSKSQNKQTKVGNKEMLNYLNSGNITNTTTAQQKNLNTLIGASQQQPYSQAQQATNKYATNTALSINNGNQQVTGTSQSAQGHHGGAGDVEYYRKQQLIKQALDIQQQTKDQHRQKSMPKGTQGRQQIAFQSHTTSVNHTNSAHHQQQQYHQHHPQQIQGGKQQSHSSQGLRKSSHGLAGTTSQSQPGIATSGTNVKEHQSKLTGKDREFQHHPKDQQAGIQSQKVLSNQHHQQQIANIDPQAIAAISQALNLKGGAANQQNNAQIIYNQILQFQGQQQNMQNGAQPSSKKQSQNTHTMIKKFLKDRATPQPISATPNGGSLLAHGTQVQHVSGGGSRQSLSPTPPSGFQSQNQLQKHQTTLIDNFTQAPFHLMQNTVASGVPSSKQAHTTKASANDSKRNFNAQKIYSQKSQFIQQPSAQQQPSKTLAAASINTNSNSYFTEQPQSSSSGTNPHHQSQTMSRKNAQERFDKKLSGAVEPGQREPTPVFHHKPYQKPDDPVEADNQAQYPMMQQPSQQQTKPNKQLAAMYMSIKGHQNDGKNH